MYFRHETDVMSLNKTSSFTSTAAIFCLVCAGLLVQKAEAVPVPGGSSFGGMYTMKRNTGNSVYAFDMGDTDYDNDQGKLISPQRFSPLFFRLFHFLMQKRLFSVLHPQFLRWKFIKENKKSTKKVIKKK